MSDRPRVAVLLLRNTRRLRTPGFLDDLRRRFDLDRSASDVVDGEWSLRAIDRAFGALDRAAEEGADGLARFEDYAAVWTLDRAVAVREVARGLEVVRPSVFHPGDGDGSHMTVRAPELAARGAEWWVAAADADDNVLVGLADDGTAALCVDSDTESGHRPREWRVTFWSGGPPIPRVSAS